MFKQAFLTVALMTTSSVSSAVELNNDTTPAAPEDFTILANALRSNGINFLGTAETGGTLFVFVDQHSTISDIICDVAVQYVDGQVFLFKRSTGISQECQR
jgi:hypothetical protein